MAGTTKKRGRPSKEDTRRAREKQLAKQKNRYRVASVILIAVAVFLCALTLIEGENLWNTLRNIIFGIFGVMAYAVGPIMLYVAIMTAYERELSKPHVVLALLTLATACGAVLIFNDLPMVGETVKEQFVGLYDSGAMRSGGGAVSFLLGWTLLKAFGKTGASITIVLLLFVFIMLLTGKTISGVIFAVRRKADAAKKISDEHAARREELRAERMKERAEKEQTAAKPAISSEKRGVNIDIPLDEAPIKVGDQIAVPFDFDNNVIKTTTPLPEKPEEHINEVIRDIKASFDKKAEPDAIKSPDDQSKEQKDTLKEGARYKYPPINLLKKSAAARADDISAELRQNADKLISTLDSFGVKATVVDISRGPSVTRYELQPSQGVKISRISGLADDIALNLATAGVRIEAPIPNKAAVGIEVPNKQKSMVGLREVLESEQFRASKAPLTMALGIDIGGKIRTADIAEMPHMLVAGTTGSGKSVCLNTIILSLVYKSSPDDVKMILVDPKSVELTGYNGIPHLLVPVVTDPKKAAGALTWAVAEMMKRYKLFADSAVKTLDSYNRKIDAMLKERQKAGESTEDIPQKQPHIVIIIDELSDLMMVAPGDVEDAICRLAQLARAAGMHLIVATQRPTVDVVTGLIKANIPSRVAFAVKDSIDSRTIIGISGAEKLLGKGDMLYMPIELNKPIRLQGCYVSDEEISAVIDFLKQGSDLAYNERVIEEINSQEVHEKGRGSASSVVSADDDDPMVDQAIDVVVEAGQASTSLLQRRLKLGYARAARIVDEMEQRGIVGPPDGSKPRTVNISRNQWLEMKLRKSDNE